VVLGNGNGTFQPPQRYSVGPNGAFSAATGDLNGDGYLDVVFATSNKVGVLLNNGAQP
jgi:hypothetical protein